MEVFSTFTVLTSLFVVFSNNPIHNLLWLVITFIFSAFFLLTYNFEFLALTYMIVYVGAIAILFLFVIMMLNLKLTQITSQKFTIFRFFCMVLITMFLVQFYIIYIKPCWWDSLFSMLIGINSINEYVSILNSQLHTNFQDNIFLKLTGLLNLNLTEYVSIFHQTLYDYFYNNSVKWLGYTLYTNYYILFLICGFVLLVGMLAAIIIVANRGEVLYWKSSKVPNNSITQNWVWQTY